MGAQPLRRPREPRGHLLPPGDEHGAAPRHPGRASDRRGVDGLGRGVAAGGRRRPGVHPEVEHGLDARHPRVLLDRPGAPQVAPRPAHLRAHLRLERELRAALQPRRGGAPQGVAAHRSCRATGGSASPTCGRCTPGCGRTPGSSCCSWGPSWPRSASGATTARSTGSCCPTRRTGVRDLLRELNRVGAAHAALWADDTTPDGFAWLDADDRESSVYAFLRSGGGGVVACVANLTPVPRHGYRLGLPRPGRWLGVLDTTTSAGAAAAWCSAR